MTEFEKRHLSAPGVLRLIGDRAEEIETGTTHLVPPGIRVPVVETSLVEASETGAVIFESEQASFAVLPPFPVRVEASYDGWRLDVVRDVLDEPRTVGVLLLRMGGFAVGIFEGRELVSSKVGSRFVKGRHSKGGSSQARFARRRDEQARALFRKACEVLRERFDAYPATLDHFLTGGDRRTVAAFEKECDYVGRFDSIRLRRFLDVGDPKKATLDALPRSLYECVLLTVSGPGS